MIRLLKRWVASWKYFVSHLPWAIKFSDFYVRVGWSDAYHGHLYDPFRLGDLAPGEVKKYRVGWERGKADANEVLSFLPDGTVIERGKVSKER